MSALRTIASALCIVLGALLIATWAASTAALSAIEEGTVIEDATTKAIATDAAQQELVTNGTEVVLGALDQAGINSNIPGIEAITREIVDAVVESDAFANVVHAQTQSVREQVVEALESTTTGPIVVTLDFSDEVNARLGQIPVIGGALPTVAVPGVPVEAMDADTADTLVAPRPDRALPGLSGARTGSGCRSPRGQEGPEVRIGCKPGMDGTDRLGGTSTGRRPAKVWSALPRQVPGDRSADRGAQARDVLDARHSGGLARDGDVVDAPWDRGRLDGDPDP